MFSYHWKFTPNISSHKSTSTAADLFQTGGVAKLHIFSTYHPIEYTLLQKILSFNFSLFLMIRFNVYIKAMQNKESQYNIH